ncbi:hypothetical protein C2E23DRAFT_727763 [Lenzites betulinus]|nr:hypothetical protein C2E23DRAFT_727763 [Lenzites betulinus]
MNPSVDDLIASFNANHIGQEAIELAALQAQLSQALFAQHRNSHPMNAPRAAGWTTPTSRTPSMADFEWENATWESLRGGSSSTKMRCSIDEGQRDAGDMDEDERMVEDLLFSPTSPPAQPASFARAPPQSAAPATSANPSSALRQRKASLSVNMLPHEHAHHDLPSPNTSLFATTDPFYLASLQNAHAHAPASSVFAQAGRPSMHSPFIKHHHMSSMYAGFGHGYQAVAPDVQPHNMFATTATFSA